MKSYTNNKNEIIKDVINVYNEYNFISKKFYYKKGKYSFKSIEILFGNFMNLIEEINKNNFKINFDSISKEDLINDIKKLHNKYGMINYKIYRNEGKYNYKYIIDIFGSFNNMKNELNINIIKYKEKTREDILKLGREYFNEFKSLKKMEFIKNKNISYTDFNNKFTSYKEFIKLLGLENDIKLINSKKISNKLQKNNNSIKKLNLNKDEVEKIILNIYNNKKYNDFTSKYLISNSILYMSIIKKYYGSFSEMKKKLKLYNNKEYFLLHRNELDEYLLSLYSQYGKLTRDIIKKFSVYGYKMILRIYGSHQEMLDKLSINLSTFQYKNMPTNILLYDLYDLYNKYNEISKEIIDKYGKYNYRLYYYKIGNIQQMYNALNIIKYNTNSSISSIGTYAISIISDILLTKPETEKTFDWLINPKTNYNLKLDAYYSKYNLAIEYNGIQHYEHFIPLDKTYNDFLIRIERDKIKEQLCNDHQIILLKIKYDEPLNFDYLKNRLMENNIVF